MRLWSKVFAACLLSGAWALGAPVDFGMEDLLAAVRETGRSLSIETELNLDPPESFRIVPLRSGVRVAGGDLRGLMYGLLAAAQQLRTDGKVSAVTAKPAFEGRGVRMTPTDIQVISPSFFSGDRWRDTFQMMARARLNRLTLVMPLAAAELDRIRFLSRTAADYGVDFILGIRGPMGDASRAYAKLRQLLDEAVVLRGIEITAGDEPLAYYQQTILRLIKDTGRRVTLDVHRDSARFDIVKAALDLGIALRLTEPPGAEAPFELHNLLPHTEPNVTIPQRLESLRLRQATAFEIEVPGADLRQNGNIFTSWGQLGYDHKTR